MEVNNGEEVLKFKVKYLFFIYTAKSMIYGIISESKLHQNIILCTVLVLRN